MKRPYFLHFLAISNGDHITIKAAITRRYTPLLQKDTTKEIKLQNSSPLESFRLLLGREFRIKIVAHNAGHQFLYEKEHISDAFGNFDLLLPSEYKGEKVTSLEVYELSTKPGIQLLLGTYLPMNLSRDLKILISDFDRTLLDTRFSTPKEVAQSLSHSLDYFPTLKVSVQKLKDYQNNGFHPFILSASPHFYEAAINGWLFEQNIVGAPVFLKDYRSILSFFEGLLTPKDIKGQGFYKLNSLVTILLMTGIPKELVLLGDAFESDPFIYLLLYALLTGEMDSWELWHSIKGLKTFRFSIRQSSQFLQKFNKLSRLMEKSSPPKIKIYIRCNNVHQQSEKKRQSLPLESLNKYLDVLEYYLS